MAVVHEQQRAEHAALQGAGVEDVEDLHLGSACQGVQDPVTYG